LKKNKLPCLLFFSDFERAFDSLEHNFIFKCLEHLNFGNSFIQWIKLFYKSAQSAVINNGYISDFFPIERGVRQGCPLSSSLFVVCIEFLSQTVHEDKIIKGITINNKEIKQTLFADDATFVNNGEKQSFERLINIISEFENVSGLKLNTSKSTILRVGTLNKSNITFSADKNFIWTSSHARTLGITFYCNREQNLRSNLEPKILEFKNCLKQWQHRKLTLLGKVTVIKTFALPKLIYPFTVLENPSEKTLIEVNHALFNFLWDGKPDKIKRNEIVKRFENGGLKVTDIKCFLTSVKACWVKRLLNEENKGMWKNIYSSVLNKHGGNLIFECNLNSNDIKRIFNKNIFLANILTSWREISVSCEKSNKIIEQHVLWNNSEIKNDHGTFFNKNMYSKGIKFIEQLYDFRKKQFYTFNEATLLFNLDNRDFLEYYKIIKSIPPNYVRTLDQTIITGSRKNYILDKLKTSKTPNKFFYDILLRNRKTDPVKSENKWETILQNKNIKWKKVYSNTFISSIDTIFRNFQYKYLKRIIPTNKYLYTCNLCISQSCDFCNSHVETIEHLFWNCPHSQLLWSQLQSFLNTKGLSISFNLENISLGIANKIIKDSSINYIIIACKYYIFKMKIKKSIPNFEHFKSFLDSRIDVEKEVAFYKNKLERHQVKWSFYK
jgi:hypothetical protein